MGAGKPALYHPLCGLAVTDFLNAMSKRNPVSHDHLFSKVGAVVVVVHLPQPEQELRRLKRTSSRAQPTHLFP